MLFCSQAFLGFFLLVFLVYWALPWHRPRVWFLLAASVVFYASWSRWLACIVFCSAALDYAVALGMDRCSSAWKRRLFLLASLAANLGLLVYFKYANFFLRSLEEALHAWGASYSLPTLQVIIPIGLSFYTFEAINYTVDVYRRHIRAERNFANFMLFILFFPHLVAGPIVRARDFLPQVRRRKRPSWPRFHLGGQLILLGLCKKLVLADQMAQFAEPVFANPAAFDTLTLWLGALAYAFQVYGDFSGYSDLAVGTAHLLGFRLVENFNMPFLAVNVADLWRRWHISLSTWIRDYLFFPLGGSRGSRWLTFRNLLITMTLCGLWHGANWPMVAWGFLHGCFLCIHLAFRSFCQSRPGWQTCLESAPGTAGRIALTFLAFVLSLVVFRTQSLGDGAIMLQGMFGLGEGIVTFDPRPVFAAVVLVVLGHALGINERWRRILEPLPSPARGALLAAALCCILLLAPVTTKTFIYFQF